MSFDALTAGRLTLTLVLVPLLAADAERGPAPDVRRHDAVLALVQGELPAERALAGRVCGAAHTPAPPGSGVSRTSADLERYARAFGRAQAATADHEPSAAWLRAALGLLFGEDPRGMLAALDQACNGPSCPPEIESDRGAALLELARRNDDLEPAVQALETLERALEARPSPTCARFNRALALETLHLDTGAIEAWRALLAVEPEGPWAAEARTRLEALEAPRATRRHDPASLRQAALDGSAEPLAEAVERGPQAARLIVQDELLPAWAERRRAGDRGGAASLLAAARRIGERLAQLEDDELLPRTLGALEETARPQDLLAGLVAYGGARRAYEAARLEESAPLFEQAARQLTAADVPLAGWARWHAAACVLQRGDVAAARSAYAGLVQDVAEQPFPHLRGHALRAAGLALALLGRSLDAAVAYRRAARDLDRTADVVGQARLSTLEDEIWEYLGEPRVAWNARKRALQRLPQLGDDRSAQVLLDQAASSFERHERPRVALCLQDEWIALARRTDDPVGTATAFARRARTLATFDRQEAAMGTLDEGARALERVTDASLRRRVAAEIDLARGFVLAPIRADEARRALLEARGYFETAGAAGRVPETDLLLARVARLTRNPSAAARHLEDAIAGYERESRTSSEIVLSDYAIGALHEAIDGVVADLALRRRRPDLAFAYAERVRGRILLDLWSVGVDAAHAPAPQTLAEVSRQVAAGETLLVYESLPETLLAWRITRGRFRFHRLPLGRAELERRVAELGADARLLPRLRSKRAALTTLYAALIAPLLDRSTDDTTLVIVPDGALHAMPFAALIDPTTGRTLIESHALSLAPSASIHLAARRAAQSRAHDSARHVLVVAPPALAPALARELDPLPAGDDEAASIARLHSGATLIGGQEATVERFLEELRRSDLVHFTGHALVHPADPGAAALLLAPDAASSGGGAEGTLRLADVRRLRLQRPQLVVLSACSTGAGPRSQSEGLMSLAASFLSAGVPAVVGSRWSADDEATRVLMIAFHKALVNGLSGAEALRRAQLELLHGERQDWQDPAYWAAFTLLGATTALPAKATR